MKYLFLLLTLVFSGALFGQLTSGYSKSEAAELMKVNFRFADSTYYDSFPGPERFHQVYRSKAVGFDNMWDLWEDENGVGVLSVRGTTKNLISWGSNFNSAMIPAKGWIKISEKDTFHYALANDPKALVHVGWTVSLGCLWKDMEPQLNAFLASGKRQIFVTGHSQGGAIAYLLTAHLRMLQQAGKLPVDLVLKTYCSAAPKPGNLFFAYDYEVMTHGGWAFNTINAYDWVPETPFSVHTVNDFNTINPFTDAKKGMKTLPFFPRLFIKHAYNKMDRPTRKAERHFRKYLGHKINKLIAKTLPGFEVPSYSKSFAYERCGQYVILMPKADYVSAFPQDPKDLFGNHMILPYLFLLDQFSE